MHTGVGPHKQGFEGPRDAGIFEDFKQKKIIRFVFGERHSAVQTAEGIQSGSREPFRWLLWCLGER